MTHLVRPRLHHDRRDRGDQGRQDPRRPDRRARRPRRVQRHRAADQVPGRLLLTSSPAATTSQAAHCTVTGVYTNKAPGGVAYACSFRVTEAVYLVERMVDVLADELEMDPAELRLKNFIRPEQFPYTNKTGWEYDSGDYEPAMRMAHGDGRLRRAAPRAGGEAGPRRAHGHRRLVLHRDRRRRARASTWTSSGSAWPTAPRCGCTRPARPSCGSRCRARARATRRRSRRSSPRSSASRPRTSRSCTATPTRPRSGWAPTAAGRPRSAARRWRWPPARCGTRRRRSPRRCSEARPEDLEWEKGRWFVKGDPSGGKTIPEIALGAHGTVALPEGVDGNLDAEVTYDPPNLTFPFGAYICVVDVDPGTGKVKVRRFVAVDDCGTRINPMIVEGQVHGGLADGVGHGADGVHRLRRARQLPRRVVHGLPDPDRDGGARLGDRAHGHPVAAPPDRRQGHRGVGDRRLAAGRGQRGRRRAGALRRRATWTCRCTPARVWAAMQGRATPPI